jgi:hypothetical protein
MRTKAKTAVALMAGRREFDKFRKRRRGRRAFPPALWSLAVELAGVHGLYQTARALGLDYYSLKKHVEAAAAVGEGESGFIEVVPGPPAAVQCTIELEQDGSRMRIDVRGGSLPDLAAITSAFRCAQS